MGCGVDPPLSVTVSYAIINKKMLSLFIITVVTCESLFIPSGTVGGLTVLFSDVIYNSTATYLCNEIGYELIGSSERICEANGNWSNTQPSCQCKKSLLYKPLLYDVPYF